MGRGAGDGETQKFQKVREYEANFKTMEQSFPGKKFIKTILKHQTGIQYKKFQTQTTLCFCSTTSGIFPAWLYKNFSFTQELLKRQRPKFNTLNC